MVCQNIELDPCSDFGSNNVWCSILHFMSEIHALNFRLEEFAMQHFLVFFQVMDTDFGQLEQANILRVLKLRMKDGYSAQLRRDLINMILEDAKQGHFKVLKTLLRNGIHTLMPAAAREGHFHLVKFLIERVGIDEKGTRIDPPIHEAATGGHLQIVKLFVENGVDCSQKSGHYNQTPLHNAADKGHVDILKFLVERGVDINAQDQYGGTALHYACHSGKLGAVKFLVEEGAALNIEVKHHQ